MIEGYLLHSNTNIVLSSVTDPMYAHVHIEPWKYDNLCRSIHSSSHLFSLRIVNVFLYLLPSFPRNVYKPSFMDCSLGKSESSIHPINHSQTQSNEQNRIQNYQVRPIVVEEDL